MRGHCARHRRVERLSGLDASFLYIDSLTRPLHVCSILEPDTSTVPGGYTFDRLRGELAFRIAAIPEFRAGRQPAQSGLSGWIEDDATSMLRSRSCSNARLRRAFEVAVGTAGDRRHPWAQGRPRCTGRSGRRSADQATAAFSRGITSVAARTALSMDPYMTAEVSVPAQWMRSHPFARRGRCKHLLASSKDGMRVHTLANRPTRNLFPCQ
jgi:hypothetical protein